MSNDSNKESSKMQPEVTRLIRAIHTDETVRVYQAYNAAIAESAVEAQSFEAPYRTGLWKISRLTWIKPSKVWMAYRCGWTELKDSNQSRVLALDLDRQKFEEMLAQAALTHEIYSDKQEKRCKNSSVVVQWDPERIMNPRGAQVFTHAKTNIRSIQIGIRPPKGSEQHFFLEPNVVKRITDVTEDFRGALQALKNNDPEQAAALLWPGDQKETPLEVPVNVQERLAMTDASSPIEYVPWKAWPGTKRSSDEFEQEGVSKDAKKPTLGKEG